MGKRKKKEKGEQIQRPLARHGTFAPGTKKKKRGRKGKYIDPSLLEGKKKKKRGRAFLNL